MAWRQKQWKYKNSTIKQPKKEDIIAGLSCGKLLNSFGNHIQSSGTYMAFNEDHAGSLGILPLETKGRPADPLPLLHAHSDFVSDFNFSPHDNSLLATCSFDGSTKVWQLPSEAEPSQYGSLSPLVSLKVFQGRVDAVSWNPVVDKVLSVGSQTEVKVFDIAADQEIYSYSDHGDMVQTMSWSPNGSQLATTCRDQILRVIDPRTPDKPVWEAPSHTSPRDSRVCWLSENLLLTSGFEGQRTREAYIFDSRNGKLESYSLGEGSGVLMPLYDGDTNMMFLIGKGDSTISLSEVKTEGVYLTQVSSSAVSQIKGACLVPKRALDVMQGEVNRILLLTKDSIFPLMVQVPRRSYADFHADLFPDTYSGIPIGSCDEWLSGNEGQITKVSLDPSRTSKNGHISGSSAKAQPKPTSAPTAPAVQSAGDVAQPPPVSSQPAPREPTASAPSDSTAALEKPSAAKPSSAKGFKVTARQSKFKHLEGIPLHKSTHIDNIRNLSISVPGECDGFHANEDRCAVLLKGTAGLMAVLELASPGRLPDTGLPVVTNGSTVGGFEWDPFNKQRLVVGCDNGYVKLWDIPTGGLTETLEDDSAQSIAAHSDRILLVKYHPLAKDVMATAAYDSSVKLWNMETCEALITLEGHTQPIFCLSWSEDGRRLSTQCRDGQLRVYEPRVSAQPLCQGPGPPGTRGCRLVWVLEDKYIVASGFARGTQVLELYDPADLSQSLESFEIGTSSTLLVPFYDRDSRSLFLTGKGDSLVMTYEVADEAPYFFPMTNYKALTLHQALSFLPKNSVNIRMVEFAKCYRLTQSSVEPISFVVPRVKTEFFQDDIFPPTYQSWVPSLSAAEWFSGQNAMPKLISLQPEGMSKLSEAPQEARKTVKYDSYNPDTYKTDAQRKEDLVNAVVQKLELSNEPLPQDLTEGCDSDEWSD